MHYINSGDTLRKTLFRFGMYFLFGLVTIALTVISVFAVQGYDLDRKSGQLIRNGLLLVDSAPENAQVYLNGKLEDDKTPSRFALPNGNYDVQISLEGHRRWSRNLDIVGSEVTWLYYPKLVPDVVSTSVIRDVNNLRIFAQSRDNKQILINTAAEPTKLQVLRTASDDTQSVEFDIPARLLIGSSKTTTLKLLDWHNAGRHLLIKVTQGKQNQIIWIDATNQSASLVVPGSKVGDYQDIKFAPDPTKLVYLDSTGKLFTLDLEQEPLTPILISENVTTFTRDLGSLNYGVRKNGETYELFSLDEGQLEVLITTPSEMKMPSAATYEGDIFVSLVRGNKLSIYRNPKPNEASVAEKVITLSGMDGVSFSTHGRFLLVTAPKKAEIYDFERTRSHKLNTFGSNNALTWLDSPRLSAVVDGQLTLLDFDGANQYQIVDSVVGQNVFIDEESRFLFSIAKSKVTNRFILQRSDLVLAE